MRIHFTLFLLCCLCLWGGHAANKSMVTLTFIHKAGDTFRYTVYEVEKYAHGRRLLHGVSATLRNKISLTFYYTSFANCLFQIQEKSSNNFQTVLFSSPKFHYEQLFKTLSLWKQNINNFESHFCSFILIYLNLEALRAPKFKHISVIDQKCCSKLSIFCFHNERVLKSCS